MKFLGIAWKHKAGNSETEKYTKLYLLSMQLSKSVFFFRYNCWISANENFTCVHKYAANKSIIFNFRKRNFKKTRLG